MIYRAIINHIILLFGVFIMLSPILLMIFASSQNTAELRTIGMQFEFGDYFIENYNSIINFETGFTDEVTPMAVSYTHLTLPTIYSV